MPPSSQHPFREGGGNYFQSLHATETEISSGLIRHLARIQTLATYFTSGWVSIHVVVSRGSIEEGEGGVAIGQGKLVASKGVSREDCRRSVWESAAG